MGRVASHVVHHADRPVAVVPHASPHVHGAPIVVGLDGSAANRRAVDWSLDVASAVAGPVEAVFVHDPMADSYPHGPASKRVLGHVPTQLPHHSPCAIVVVPHR